MSRPTMTTGTIPFTLDKAAADPPDAHENAMHIVLLGDFSGRANGGRLDSDSLGQRRVIEIDRDNFEQVFSSLDIQLSLPVADEPLVFTEFDDLHPDFLYDKLPQFAQLRSLRRRLQKPDQFAAAASEIREWPGYAPPTRLIPEPQDIGQGGATASGVPMPEDLLGAVLSGSSDVSLQRDEGESIDRLIKDIVAPYVRDKAAPELAELLDAVTRAGNQLMRRICHSSAFQQLEASWRSVQLLVRRIETGPKLKLFLVDIARQEIEQDLESCGDELERSGIYQLLVEQYRIPGATRPALINLDYYVDGSEADIRLLSALGGIAMNNGAAVLCGGRPSLAGCQDIGRTADPDEWLDISETDQSRRWDSLRQLPQSRRVGLAAPRFLLRLPYGKNTEPVDSFAYTELPENGAHPYYLWGNSAYLLTLLFGQSFMRYGWSFKPGQLQVVDDFPLHVYSDSDGESQIKPCAEAMLTDRAAGRLAKSGLLPVRSIKGQADIAIAQFNALATGCLLSGPWGD